ncbi:hybrid sensor histidine kinase/response regulator [Sphaerotilus sp.]|uniref:hybrid sensor histidine kinase/response regulator n=1 Tax=Sphaerotilus sp. TaxID=2093942 RepID=UPI00286E7C0A|nr:hybrid sensor histidine kinase/response regulator [Sphaerotilus sp.]
MNTAAARLFAAVLSLLALCGLLASLAPAVARAEHGKLPAEGHAPPVIELREALFTHDLRTAPVPVPLPDTWSARGLDDTGIGHYRSRISLDTAPTTMWALCMARLSDVHEVRLNGWLVSGSTLEHIDPVVAGGHPTMQWISLPPHLLRAGVNHVELSVAHSSRGGLSTVMIGPAAAMAEGYLTRLRLSVMLPIWLNVAGTALAVFLLLIWWRRRSERLLGSFGTLWVLIAACNIAHYNMVDSASPLAVAALFGLQVVSGALLCRSAMVLSGRRHAVAAGILQISTVVLLAMAVWGGLTDSLEDVRAGSYPMVFTGVALSLMPLWRETSRLRLPLRCALAAAVVGSMLSALHDYLYWRGMTSVMDAYWLPYALPVSLAIVGGVLIKRLVGALHQVEQLNADLERRVIERTEALQQANQAKTRFLTAASHDLRQPVVTIGLLIDLMREQVPLALRPMTDRVNEAVSSMEDLLKGLLDLSRLDAGTMRPRLQTVALQPLFDAIASHDGETARRKGIALRFRPTREAVLSDPVMLEQILRNLVSNAVRYTESGGVLVAARRRGEELCIEVWDTGHGIPAAHQRTVFEEFVQLSDQRGERPVARQSGHSGDGSRGLGLGLSIVQRSATLLGHRLQLRSRQDHGSCFSILVPRARTHLPQPISVSGDARPLADLRLTVVEDEPAVRVALRARLEAWGAVVETHDGLTPLRRSLAARPRGHVGIDLLITDHRLRGATGIEVIEAVRRYGGPVPVLVITGDTAPDDIALMAASGLQVLHKPFRADALLAAITRALG